MREFLTKLFFWLIPKPEKHCRSYCLWCEYWDTHCRDYHMLRGWEDEEE